MRGRAVLILVAVALIFVLLLASIIFRIVPQPIIDIKAETLWEVGPLPIKNTLITSWVVVAIIVIAAFFSGRNLQWIPSGWQNFIEAIIEGIHTLVVSTAGEKHGRRFFWVIATMFIYITVSNWFALFPIFNVIGKVEPVGVEAAEFHKEAYVVQTGGVSFVNFSADFVKIEVDEAACEGLSGHDEEECLERERGHAINAAREEHGLGEDEELAIIAPFLRSVNTDLMSPLSLALVSAIFVEFWGISTLGFFAYGSRFFNVRRLRQGNPMGILDFFVGVLELIAELARIISFTFRLFGNMLAGEILLLVMTFLLPFTFVVLGVFYGLEIFVGAIQAFVFGMLTLVFGVLAISGHGDEHAPEEGH